MITWTETTGFSEVSRAEHKGHVAIIQNWNPDAARPFVLSVFAGKTHLHASSHRTRSEARTKGEALLVKFSAGDFSL